MVKHDVGRCFFTLALLLEKPDCCLLQFSAKTQIFLGKVPGQEKQQHIHIPYVLDKL